MNLQEVAAMCAYITAARPGHGYGEATARAWVPLLAGVSVEDARVVVPQLVAEGWVGVDDVLAAVRALRVERFARSGVDAQVPDVDPDDPVAWLAALRALRGVSGGSGSVDVEGAE